MILFAAPVLAATLIGVAKGVVFTLFVLTAIFLSIVVLLQEGKGGGLGSAFGGAAADTFGVKAGTVNRFTAWLATGFLGLALLYAGLSAGGDKVSIDPLEIPITPSTEAAPATPGEAGSGETGSGAPTEAPAGEAPGSAPEAPAPGSPPEAPAPGSAPEAPAPGEGGGEAPGEGEGTR